MILTYYTIAHSEEEALENLDNSKNAPLSTQKSEIDRMFYNNTSLREGMHKYTVSCIVEEIK